MGPILEKLRHAVNSMKLTDSSDSTGATGISVAIVEDRDGLRESLAVLINGTPGFRCVGSFPSAEVALRDMQKVAPEVVLMDIDLPKMSGVECVRRLKELGSTARILMLTIFNDGEHIFEALKAGANGYLSKSTPPAEILRSIEEIHKGNAPTSSDIANRVVEFFNQQGRTSLAKQMGLSPRESEILSRLAEGCLYKEIANQLQISYATVHWHIRNVYEKLHVSSRSQAIAKYLGHPPRH